MMGFLFYVHCQNYYGILEFHCLVSTGTILVDSSNLEGVMSTSVYHVEDPQYYTDAFQLMLYVFDLYQPNHQLLQLHASPGNVAFLAVTFFWPVLQASPV